MKIEENASTYKASRDVDRYFIPGNNFVRIFQEALSKEKNIRVRTRNLGNLILLGKKGKYFSDSEDLESLLCLPVENLSIAPLTADDMPPGGRTERDAMELMWNAAFYFSSGRLMAGYHLHDVVQLASWPNLTRLPVTPNTFRILSLFSRRPTSVYFAARLLRVSQEEMNQVYSASRAAGYIKAINRSVEEPEILPHRSHILLSSLLKKLRLGRGTSGA